MVTCSSRTLTGMAAAGLLLAGCGGPGGTESDGEPADETTEEPVEDPTDEPDEETDEADPEPEAEPEPEPEPEYEPPSIGEHAAEATWQFAPRGLNAPLEVTLEDGEAADTYVAYRHRPDLGEEMNPDVRSEEHDAAYTIGEPLEGDLTGDGVTDAVIPLTAEFGEDSETLWYLWLGAEDPQEGEPVAEQHPYPVAAAQECGNDVADLRIEDGVIHLEVSNVVSYHSDWQCDGPFASGPHDHDHQSRTVELEDIDGDPVLVQTEPVRAWGGVCPGTDAPEWFFDQGTEVTLLPDADSEVLDGGPATDLMLGGFFLGEDPLMDEVEDRMFVSYVPDEDQERNLQGENTLAACGWITPGPGAG